MFRGIIVCLGGATLGATAYLAEKYSTPIYVDNVGLTDPHKIAVASAGLVIWATICMALGASKKSSDAALKEGIIYAIGSAALFYIGFLVAFPHNLSLVPAPGTLPISPLLATVFLLPVIAGPVVAGIGIVLSLLGYFLQRTLGGYFGR